MKNLIKTTILVILFSQIGIVYSSQKGLLSQIEQDLVQFFAKNWDYYSVTTYHQKPSRDFSHLDKTFSAPIKKNALSITEHEYTLTDSDDARNKYHFGFVMLNYDGINTAKRMLNTIRNSPKKNFKNSIVFLGYTAKNCGNSTVIVYSSEITSKKVKSYFKHFENNLKCN